MLDIGDQNSVNVKWRFGDLKILIAESASFFADNSTKICFFVMKSCFFDRF